MQYPIEIIKKGSSRQELNKFLGKPFKTVVKFVVDIEKEIIALGGELHSDAAEFLIEQEGSTGDNLWGGNFYPIKVAGRKKEVEYISLINIKPNTKNYSMEIGDKTIQKRMEEIIRKLIK